MFRLFILNVIIDIINMLRTNTDGMDNVMGELTFELDGNLDDVRSMYRKMRILHGDIRGIDNIVKFMCDGKAVALRDMAIKQC